ncbi:MAG: hypothetical protein KKF16_08385 [Euryarchaeota archaeon]|nr:hypothetical protein [Euryarchaeota archaeon]MBV1729841.1 hypothetical protein [Methanobacterium sp.]MBU4547703.1 hypothetical protein [Euryarchaeota archaeon]MBU4607345.1 hypothetical protein [Euryarchaeota archaeon]MBV1754025.1 hypothetical protein [Methanobacterium sp.]
MKGETELPHTILDKIIQDTLSQLKENTDFDSKTILELEKSFKKDKPTPQDIINILKGDTL